MQQTEEGTLVDFSVPSPGDKLPHDREELTASTKDQAFESREIANRLVPN